MDLRPTADRLRETLFNVLTAGNPSALQLTVWLDLFAGTGAVGIEALSRGAEMVHFVDSSAKAAEMVRKNLKSLGIDQGFAVENKAVANAWNDMEKRGVVCDFIFLDPPYRLHDLYQETLSQLADTALVKAGTIVIAEHEKRFDPGESFGTLRRYRKLEQGDATLSFYRRE